jgi:hypothetical protein
LHQNTKFVQHLRAGEARTACGNGTGRHGDNRQAAWSKYQRQRVEWLGPKEHGSRSAFRKRSQSCSRKQADGKQSQGLAQNNAQDASLSSSQNDADANLVSPPDHHVRDDAVVADHGEDGCEKSVEPG